LREVRSHSLESFFVTRAHSSIRTVRVAGFADGGEGRDRAWNRKIRCR
jgi:hypothetical protein